jgi:hypothetical protein
LVNRVLYLKFDASCALFLRAGILAFAIALIYKLVLWPLRAA